jgi:hypothetical protein
MAPIPGSDNGFVLVIQGLRGEAVDWLCSRELAPERGRGDRRSQSTAPPHGYVFGCQSSAPGVPAGSFGSGATLRELAEAAPGPERPPDGDCGTPRCGGIISPGWNQFVFSGLAIFQALVIAGSATLRFGGTSREPDSSAGGDASAARSSPAEYAWRPGIGHTCLCLHHLPHPSLSTKPTGSPYG